MTPISTHFPAALAALRPADPSLYDIPTRLLVASAERTRGLVARLPMSSQDRAGAEKALARIEGELSRRAAR